MRQKSPVQGWRQRSGNVRKHTFVVFHFPEIHIFAICGKTKGGLEKMTHLKKSAFTSRTYLAKNNFHEWFTSPPFWGKTHFFKQIFNSRYLKVNYENIDTKLEQPEQDKKLCRENFLFIHYFENSTRYKIKSAEYSFSQKKSLFSKFRRNLSYHWIQLPNLHSEKNWKKKNSKINFWPIFFFFFYFFF